MAQLNRQLINDLNDNNDQNKKQNIEIKTNKDNNSIETSKSSFENLSNELIYEIFEYLDYFYIYDTFSNLNQRFYDLIINSNLSIKINFPVISKSKLQHYTHDILQPNQHRITYIHFSDLFIYDGAFLSFYNFMEFPRLETLIIDHALEVEYAQNLLNQLFSLPRLSSLVISVMYLMKIKNTISRQIFRLPALKYCKLSMSGWIDDGPLPYSMNEYSSIEHLDIISGMYIDELDRLLSYVPQLRRLSLHLLIRADIDCSVTINASQLKFLTHISVKLQGIEFKRFIQLFQDVFRTIEVLRITVENYHIFEEYLNADKWKDVILAYMPKLRIFDFIFDLRIANTSDLDKIKTDIEQFTSPFWTERQWLFTYQIYRRFYGNRLRLYSINSLRNKHYTLSEQQQQQLHETNSLYSQSRFNSFQCIHITNEESIMDGRDYFPNTIELIFEYHFSTTGTSFVTKLNSILPLNRLQKLVTECSDFPVQKLIEILTHTPNLHTLKLKSIACCEQGNDYTPIEQSEEFQFVSNKNTIKYVTCGSECELEQIKLLVTLCPRMEYFNIEQAPIDTLKTIIRFVSDKTNLNTRHLCFLHFTRRLFNWPRELEQEIVSELLLDDYTLKEEDSNLYLWW